MQDNKQNISWSNDLYQASVSQRKILLLLVLILSAAVIICLIWMQMTIEQNKVEPFIVEIDKKTGLATTVKPVTVQEYSGNIAVLRSLVIGYIRAREEYIYSLFDKNFSQVVRVFSNYSVYRKYTSTSGADNPSSPYSVLGKYGSISVKWKSVIFPQQNTAQIRISLQTADANGMTKTVDKIILMSFEFKPEESTSEDDRLINPLGFKVTMYKIEDENPNI